MANYNATSESGLENQGIDWSDGNTITKLVYKSGQRLWTDASIDLDQNKSYKINNTDVLSARELGPSIIKSNLRQVGTLKSLVVTGNADIGEFASFNSALNRLGLGTDLPNATLSIADNGVEIILGAPVQGRATIGTFTNHDLDIVTDNTARISIKTGGDVVIGHEKFNNGVLRVNGTIYAKSVIAEDTAGRVSSVVFRTDGDSSVYGIGLSWVSTNGTRQFYLRDNPDRFYFSESIDLENKKSLYINGNLALSEDRLGNFITQSSLTAIGTLEKLNVGGPAKFYDSLEGESITGTSLTATTGSDNLTINTLGVTTSRDFKITVDGIEDFKIGQNEIVIGNSQNQLRPLKLFGQLAIGVNSPDGAVDLEVKGNIRFANKTFITANSIPSHGNYKKGDVCWNTEPQEGGYVGWVCVVAGTPGEWKTFGAIGRQ